MSRTTLKHLEYQVECLNSLQNKPKEYMTNGKINIGHYTLSGAYGGWQLQQVMNNGGGVDVITLGGFVSKKELYNQISTYIRGVESESN